MIRVRDHRDDGVSLVVSMIFVLVVAVVTTALLTYSVTAISNVKRTNDRVAATYDVDGALETVTSTLASDYGTLCNGATSRFVPAKSASGSTYYLRVLCDSGATSYASGTTTATNLPKDNFSVVTLGTNAWEKGISHSDNNVLRIAGGVSAAGGIDQTGGNPCPDAPQPPGASANCNEIYVKYGDIRAPSCTPDPVTAKGTSIASTGTIWCKGEKPSIADPAYTQPVGSLVPPVTFPTCPGNKKAASQETITFEPGYYDSAAALNGLFTKCSPRAFWFKPGVYYFDFKDGESPSLPAASHVWDLGSSAPVIAGTPTSTGSKAWDPTVKSDVQPTVPGACVSPASSKTNGGASFVFGGDSSMTNDGGTLEVCAPWDKDQPPIAVYGIPGDNDPNPTPSSLNPFGAITVPATNQTSTKFSATDIATLASPDGQSSTMSVSLAKKNDSATGGLTLKDFLPSTVTIPKGSLLTSATLTVRHRAAVTGATATAAVSVTSTATGASLVSNQSVSVAQAAIAPAWATAATTQTISLTSALASEVRDAGFKGLTVSYSATAAASAVSASAAVDLDAVTLDLKWTPPRMRGQRVLIGGTNDVGAPTGSASVVPLIATGKNQASSTYLYLQGMTYSPDAALSIRLLNQGGQVFKWGVVVRALTISVSASSTQAASTNPDDVFLITIPVQTVKLYLTAFNCTSNTVATCSATPSGRAVITLNNALASSGSSVSVDGWRVGPGA